MGTRSNTVVINDGVKILNLYRQFDGYPSGHGAELAAFLAPLKMVNGYGIGTEAAPQFNGMGCLAAQLVANFKKGVGGFYIDNPNGDCDNDYTYTISGNTQEPDKGLTISVVDYNGTKIFNGSIKSFINFCKE
jgi:hypothetical protein